MGTTLYIDSINGLPSNTGSIDKPYDSITTALATIPTNSSGYVLVLQNGIYGSTSITKDITIQSAYGASPTVGTITVSKAQCLFQGLTFNNLSQGIVVVNDPYGSIQIKDCTFNKVVTAISLTDVNYIAIHNNRFNGDSAVYPAATYNGVVISGAKEVNISNNVFTDLIKAINVNDIYRLDVWNNTIYGGSQASASPVANHDNLKIVYITLRSSDISNKRVVLPSFVTPSILIVNTYDAATNSVNGPAFEYGVDYVVVGNGITLSWGGYALDGQLSVGDILRIMYVEGTSISGGESIKALGVVDPNSTIDSNNITGYTAESAEIQYGVFFNSPMKINNNNFYGSTGYLGTPSEAFNNITSDPLYVGAMSRNFMLTGTSPDIESGKNDRWDYIVAEMGLTGLGVGLTAAGPITREGIAPFNNQIDKNKTHVLTYSKDVLDFGATALNRLDIGSYEYIAYGHTGMSGATGLDYFVGETGSDYAITNSGDTPYGTTPAHPFVTIDRAFSKVDSGIGNVYVNVSSITGLDNGSRYGRYFSKELELNAASVNTSRGTNQDIIYVYPTDPKLSVSTVYVSPDGSDGLTAVIGYTGIYGMTGSILYGFTGGNGTESMPYRTITKAIQSGVGTSVIVEPGFYPSFSGVTGISIVGVSKTDTVTMSTQSYQKLNFFDWGVTGTGTSSFSSSTLYLTGNEYVTSSFSANTRLEYKAYVNKSQGTFSTILDNPYNSITISFENGSGATGTIKTKFFAGITGSVTGIIGDQYYAGYGISGIVGSNYTYSYPDIDHGVTGIAANTKVIINGNKAEVFVNGLGANIYKSFLLAHSYTNDWKVHYETNGETGVMVSKLSVNADTLTTVVPTTETSVKHKLYGLYGSKTL